ncbi:MAG: phosphotransferase [Anaerolineaceae bacterium]
MLDTTAPWDTSAWLEEARAWIITTLEEHGLHIKGAVEQIHIRPWSTILRTQTNKGQFFFKAAAPFLDYEPALLDLLTRLYPDNSPDLLKIDLSRGWILMGDSGIPLRTFIKADKNVDRWHDIVTLYVRLQKEMVSHVDKILHLGVFDRRLESLPEKFELLVSDQSGMLLDQHGGLTSDEYQRLKSMRENFRQMCAELSAYGIPATLHHDDFHDGNVFLQGNHVIFTDWGESAIAHPFFTLVVMLRGVENSLDLTPEALEVASVRKWYLAEWQDYMPLSDLQRAAVLAEQIGLVNRAITWRHVISNMPTMQKPEYLIAVPSYLKDFIDSL